MNKYEGLFILNTQGKEEGIKDALDKISAEISAVGGKIETVQKMERKQFARVADKRNASGFYANIIFEATPAVINQLQTKFKLNADVFRVLFTAVPEVKPAK
jgi:ribosomal protein S6